MDDCADETIQLPVLERTCGLCYGTGDGYSYGYNGYRDCERCHGTGFVPTEAGQAILQLMWNNRPLIEE